MFSFPLRLLLIWVLWIVGNDGQVNFIRKYDGKKVLGLVGSSINFTWTFSNGVERVVWGLKDPTSTRVDVNKKLISIGLQGQEAVTRPEEYSGRVNGTGSISSGSVIFTLNNIKISDDALYGCELFPVEAVPPAFDHVYLVVHDPPKITHISANTTVNEGDTVSLKCTADGIPRANVTWSKDIQAVDFPLTNINRKDSGSYRCTAKNGVGNPATADVFITVQYAATITSVNSSTSKAWIGQTVKLKCVSDGVPTPTVIWKKADGTKIWEGASLKVTANFTLKSDKDFGNITCSATNGLDKAATKTVQVLQIKAPGSPNFTVNVQATSITVNWTKPADNGGSPITAYRALILQGNSEIKNKNITDLSTMQKFIGGLKKSTNYTVRMFARNYVFEGNASERKIRTKFEGVPAAAEIINLPAETNKTEIILKWREAEDNGAPITEYNVYQRIVHEDGTSLEWKKITEITDSQAVVKLEHGKDYEFVVTATNRFGEGGKDDGKIKKIKVLGDVPSPVNFTYKVKDDKLIFKWEEPNSNGANITFYTVYYGTVNENITDLSKLKYAVKVEKGQKYKVVVTASNKYGESSKKGKIQQVNVPKGPEPSAQPKTSGLNTAVIVGAAAGGVLVIIGVIIFAIWWTRRKRSPNDTSSSQGALRNGNPYEEDDGYHTVRASVAAQGLQASGRPVAEPSYAQVDMSKKKRNRRPVTDEYAQVDKSKKSKKPRKRPGELDYAELDDLRPNIQPAAAEAAPARPLVRRPAYEGTEYADIAQFGVPQPEPTYGNVPKKDVVYSNVQGI